jgi:hypothetical protein
VNTSCKWLQRLWAVGGLLAVLAASTAFALERGVTGAGIAYVSGGVGESEQQALREGAPAYSLWLTTATRSGGAFLAGVRVRIVEAGSRHPVLEHTTDGPWLFVALPPGRYDVEASFRDGEAAPWQVQKTSVQVTAATSQHRLTLFFEAADQPIPRGEKP